MIVGVCEIELYLPGVSSLKEKRGIVKSLLARLHNTFNVSAAEVAHQDIWQSARIGLALVSSSTRHIDEVYASILEWIESHYPDAIITRHQLDLR